MTKIEPTRELREERERMCKRLSRLMGGVSNTPKRRQNWAIRTEIEVIQENIAALERRYRFD